MAQWMKAIATEAAGPSAEPGHMQSKETDSAQCLPTYAHRRVHRNSPKIN